MYKSVRKLATRLQRVAEHHLGARMNQVYHGILRRDLEAWERLWPRLDDVDWEQQRWPQEKTIVHLAVEHYSAPLLRSVLDHTHFTEALGECVDDQGKSPLHYACERGNLAAAEMLHFTHVFTGTDRFETTPVLSAMLYGADDIVRLLTESYTSHQWQQELKALASNRLEGVKNLQPYAVKMIDQGALAGPGKSQVAGQLLANTVRSNHHPELVALWVYHGADPSRETQTVHLPMVTALLDAGSNGVGLLFYACRRDDVATVKLLLSKTYVDVNARNEWGQTPLLAVCDPLPRYDPILPAMVEELFVRADLHVDARDRVGYTALMHAALKDEAPVVKRLLQRGANLTSLFQVLQTWTDTSTGQVQKFTCYDMLSECMKHLPEISPPVKT